MVGYAEKNPYYTNTGMLDMGVLEQTTLFV